MVSAAVMAGFGGASVIAVALFVWWVVTTLRSADNRASGFELRATVAEAGLASKTETLAKLEDAYAKLDDRFQRLVPLAIASANERDAVVLAGGDPGPSPSDGLLEPEWDAPVPDAEHH